MQSAGFQHEVRPMARPQAKQLTERELEVMRVFWKHGELTIAAVRNELSKSGRVLAYTTVATVVRILHNKKFIEQVKEERAFSFRPIRAFEDVAQQLLNDFVHRTFDGSWNELLKFVVKYQTRVESASRYKGAKPARRRRNSRSSRC